PHPSCENKPEGTACSLRLRKTRLGRPKWRHDALLLQPRFFRERIEDESARANDQLREFQLARFARKFFGGVTRASERRLPFRITRRFILQKLARGFPISDRQIIDAADPELVRRLEQTHRAIFVGINGADLEAL